MREILFRGKRMYNGEWVYGWPFADTADCSLKKAGKCGCPHDGSEYFIVEWVDDYHEYEERQVIPNTVGQYTGLKDKNGKQIFEGDIMAFSVFGFDYVGSVEIVNGHASVMCKNARPYLHQAVSKYEAYIIGNIHDNLELLEGNVVCGDKSVEDCPVYEEDDNDFITKKRLNDIPKHLESDSADQTKAENVDDFYWRCGNANAVNYIRYKLGMEVGNG